MSPTSFDVLQLCVIAYLKMGETEEAARLLKILVNEEYNTSTNAKLLSRIYVSQPNKTEQNSYNALQERIRTFLDDQAATDGIPNNLIYDHQLKGYRIEEYRIFSH